MLCAEVLPTVFFFDVILWLTRDSAPTWFAPLAIGLCVTLAPLTSIPISNTSVKPAWPTAVALISGSGAPGQFGLFWVAPVIGARIACATFHLISRGRPR